MDERAATIHLSDVHIPTRLAFALVKRALEACLFIDQIQAGGLSRKHAIDATNSRIHRYVELFPRLLTAGRTRLPRRKRSLPRFQYAQATRRFIVSSTLCFSHLCLPFGKRRTQIGDVGRLGRGICGARSMGCRERQHGRRRRGHEGDQNDHKRDATAVGAGTRCIWLRMVHAGSAAA